MPEKTVNIPKGMTYDTVSELISRKVYHMSEFDSLKTDISISIVKNKITIECDDSKALNKMHAKIKQILTKGDNPLKAILR